VLLVVAWVEAAGEAEEEAGVSVRAGLVGAGGADALCGADAL
jgi:hypothetical protein